MISSLITNHFYRVHLWWPLLGFTLVAAFFGLTHTDLLLADIVYQYSGGYWRFEDAWFTSTLVHEGGRTLVVIMALALILVTAAAQFVSGLHRWRRGLWYLLLSTLLSGVVINLLKTVTHVDCPWDLLRYGGSRVYVPVFGVNTANAEMGACFPAGHSSAAYAWLGWYFFCHQYMPHWRFRALGSVLAMGGLFGFSQQLRGAHFMSHDLWTLGICWMLASILYIVMFHGHDIESAEKRKNRGTAASIAVIPLES